jgi:chromosome partitioning protein
MNAFAILSMKGGVGKTTVTVNLGAALSALGRKVLLIDMDSQHDLTQSLGFDAFQIKGVEFLLEKDLKFPDVVKEYSKNLHILPAGKKLKKLELSLSNMLVKTKDSYFSYLLRNALEKVQDDYDYILVDCPPSGGFLTVNALTFTDNVIIPVQCQFLGYEAAKRTISFISRIKTFNNPHTRVSSVVPVMFDPRNKLSNIILDRLRNSFNGTLTNSMIRVNTALAEAPAFGKTIFDYKPVSRGAEDFLQLAREIMARYEGVTVP